MGKITLYSEFPVGDMLLQYYQNDGLMEMGLIPAAMKDQVADHRKELPPVATFLKLYYLDPAAFDSLVQFKLRQDGASGGHYAGSTMRSRMVP